MGSPRRLISLCPSQTETLLALGAPVVGRTRYCVHPADQIATLPTVGGTKKLDFDAVATLQPDLIIAEKEENRREDVETLAERWPVFVTDVRDHASALRMVRSLGSLCGREPAASQLAADIERRWAVIPRLRQPRRVLYLIWRKPWMAAGGDTYIQSVLDRLGFINVAAELPGRYPELSAAQLRDLQPELILLSSEPYPFAQKHLAEMQALAATPARLVDGEMFSWYGVRMLEAADYLADFVSALS